MRTYHGKTNTPEYKVWNNMLSRCLNPNHPRYKDWGGRGIKVSPKWKTFIGFYEDMGDRPSPEHTLERINNSKDYSKDNCRWATTKDQSSNRRSNVFIVYDEYSYIPRDFAEKFNLNKYTVASQLARGWSSIEIISGKRTATPRLFRTIAKHKAGGHSRKCEIYIKKNTYQCKFTDEIFNKGVAYARLYK